MKIKAIARMKYFEIDLNNRSKEVMHKFRLTKKESLFNEHFSSDMMFNSIVGSNSIKNIKNNPFVFYVGDEERLKRTFNVENQKELLYSSINMFVPFLFCLWLVKDNSVNVDSINLYYPDRNNIPEEDYWYSNTLSYVLYSNSSGLHETTLFSELEIDEALKYFNLYFYSNDIQYKKLDTYYVLSRRERAEHFIMLARGTSLMPLKITFYVAHLESLLTTDNTEVSHKVTERAVKIIGGDLDNKLKNFKLIKDCYSVRSNYMHGQQNSKMKKNEREQLTTLSNEIDSLIRGLYLELLKNSQIFEYNDSQLEEWFKKLVLE